MGHQPTRRVARSAASVATAALTLLTAGLFTAVPAHAAAPGSYLFVDAPDSVTVLPRTAAAGPGDTFRPFALAVADEEGGPLRNVVVTVDASALAGKAELQLPAGCTFTDTAHLRVSCTAARAADEADFRLGVRAVQGAPVGASGTVRYTAAADGAVQEPDSVTTEVAVGSGPDLAVKQLPSTTRVAPGGSTAVPAEVANIGDQDAKGLVMIAETQSGFRLSGNYRNCRYGVNDGASVGGSAVLCRFDSTTLPAGATYRLSEPLTVAAGKDVGSGFLGYVFDVAGGEIDGSRVTGGTPGTGPELTLAPVPGTRSAAKDIDFDNNTAVTILDTGLRTDLAVAPVAVSGTVGKPLALDLTVRNVGTAAAQPVGTAGLQVLSPGEVPSSASALVLVSLPAGVAVQRAPRYCAPVQDVPVPAGSGEMAQRFTSRLRDRLHGALTRAQGAPQYLCWLAGKLPAGGSASLAFTVKPGRALDGVRGQYMALSLSLDDNGSNDLALIRLSAKGATATGSTGSGSTGGGSPAPQTAGGTSTGGTSAGGSTTGGAALAATGSSGTGLLAGAGAVAVVAGAGAVLAVRRRRA
ncbi:LPXTG cell wall anchor domain-containing protein [Peterkaempfera sp. SMS 1(5)a]|uniref:LPXTG cell wall anchor domain-containing protein n=1 Tax=Peterkaempfera podocarpi TaxID=3232308 RepID=UPI00366C702B